jgi:hypothetical protein
MIGSYQSGAAKGFAMQRRDILTGLLSSALGAAIPGRSGAVTQDEIARRVQDYRRKAMEQFPLKLIEATGEQALAKWQELKSAEQGTPVVLGGDDDGGSFSNLLDPFGPNGPYVPPLPSVEDILKKAAGIQFPDDLAKRKKADSEAALQRMKDMLAAKPDMPLPTITESKGGQTRTLTREETIAAMGVRPPNIMSLRCGAGATAMGPN